MRNIRELRDSLIANYEGIQDKTLDLKTASELNNTAGKIIATVTTELKYQNQHGTKKSIDFLEYDQKEPK